MTVVAPRFFYKLPRTIQDIMVTSMGAWHRWRRNDPAEQAAFLVFLRQSQYWDRDRFEEYQLDQLRTQLSFACREVSHFRRLKESLGFSIEDFRSLDSLALLPILNKDQIKESPADFLPNDPAYRGTIRSATSGTTGTPMVSYYTRRAFARQWACVALLREWHGVTNGLLPHRIQLTGSPVFDPGREFKRPYRWNRAARTMLVPVNGISERTVRALLEGIDSWGKAEIMDGYPSALAHLAWLGKEKNITPPKIPLIITTAEQLGKAQRDLLEDYFSAKVIDQYAASEPSCFAGECEKGSLHVFPESGILELIPLAGEDPAAEHLARIVMTPFHNTAQVFCRYDIGDLAKVIPGKRCPCGRETPVIEAIEGRSSCMIQVESPLGRRVLTSALLSTGFYGFNSIARGQIVQTGPRALTLRCELARSMDDQERIHLVENFRRVCGSDVEIEMEVVERIHLGPGGKFIAVVPLKSGNGHGK